MKKSDIPKADCYMVLDTADNSFMVVKSREDVLDHFAAYAKSRICYPINLDDFEWLTLNVVNDCPRPFVEFVDDNGIVDTDEAMV